MLKRSRSIVFIHLYTEQLAEYRLYPRAIAIAEVGWSPPSRKNFADFIRRLDYASQHMDAYAIHYHIPQPEEEMPTNQLAFIDRATLSFGGTRPIKIVYTTDGSDPTPNSPVVAGSLAFEQDTLLKLRSIMNSGKMSPVRSIHIEKQQYMPASTPANIKAGLRLATINGYYLNMQQLEASQSKSVYSIMTETRELPAPSRKRPQPSQRATSPFQRTVSISSARIITSSTSMTSSSSTMMER